MQEAAEESGLPWPDSWWHAVANWSFLDVFVIINGLGCAATFLVYARYYWRTRRVHVQRDAPTPDRWIKPHKHTDISGLFFGLRRGN